MIWWQNLEMPSQITATKTCLFLLKAEKSSEANRKELLSNFLDIGNKRRQAISAAEFHLLPILLIQEWKFPHNNVTRLGTVRLKKLSIATCTSDITFIVHP